jgi:gamma-glutamylcyclotransferase (GGCT)/AIG2-like uncharacterized protein YtfP
MMLLCVFVAPRQAERTNPNECRPLKHPKQDQKKSPAGNYRGDLHQTAYKRRVFKFASLESRRAHTRNPAVTERHVFVYGTLRRGQANDINRLLPAPRFVGLTQISGVMVHLGAYPGVVLGPSGAVVGEVYAIEPELERVLDEIEEVFPQGRDEYFKRALRVTVGERQIDCLVYEINPAYVEGRPVIASGDWVQGRG